MRPKIYQGYVVLLLVTTLSKFEIFVTIFAYSAAPINEVCFESLWPTCGLGVKSTFLLRLPHGLGNILSQIVFLMWLCSHAAKSLENTNWCYVALHGMMLRQKCRSNLIFPISMSEGLSNGYSSSQSVDILEDALKSISQTIIFAVLLICDGVFLLFVIAHGGISF